MFRKLKRNKLLAGSLLLCTIALSGCSSDSSNSTSTSNNTSTSSDTSSSPQTLSENSEKIVLTLWHYYNGTTKDMLDNMIDEFNETLGLEKNITVEAYSHSNVSELASALVSAANKEVGMDDMPDIFAAYSDTALLLNDLGVVAPVDSYFTDEELSLFRQEFLDEGRFGTDGTLKILPVAKSTEILFINDSDFQIFSDATGVTLSQLDTWESMAEVAQIYYDWTDSQTEEPYDGRALFGIDSEANFMIIGSRQTGEEIYDYNGDTVTFGLSENGAKKIWDNYMVPYIKGHYISYGSFRSDDIKSGDLLMYAGSTSSVYYFPSSVELGRTQAYDIVGTTMPYPYFEGSEKIAIQQGAGMVVSKSDEIREAASVEFLKWFSAAEYNLDFAVSTGYIPVQNEALEYDSVLSVLEEYSNGEISDVVLSTIDTTYNYTLPEYTFYANQPFDGSYDARNAITNYIVDTLKVATDELAEQTEQGADRDTVISELTSDESFKDWYIQFETTINSILIK